MMEVGAGRRVAAGTNHVVEYLLSPETIRLPLTPAYCPAVLIWREQIIPSLDLAQLAPNPEPARHEWHGAVVLAYQEAPGMPLRYGAVLVHAAPQETWVSNNMACPLPEESTAFQHFSSACFAHEEKAVPVLDTHRLFCETLPWTPISPRNGKPAPSPPAASPAGDTTTDVSHATASPSAPRQEDRSARRQRAQQVVGETLSAVHEQVGLKRVLLSVLARDGSIRPHYYRGVDKDSPLRGLHFERGDSSLFARLVEKPQHLWLGPANRDKLAPLIGAGMRRVLDVGEFFASSIFVRGKLLGVCYADNFESTEGLDEYHYHQFKEWCTSMAKRLGEITE